MVSGALGASSFFILRFTGISRSVNRNQSQAFYLNIINKIRLFLSIVHIYNKSIKENFMNSMKRIKFEEFQSRNTINCWKALILIMMKCWQLIDLHRPVRVP